MSNWLKNYQKIKDLPYSLRLTNGKVLRFHSVKDFKMEDDLISFLGNKKQGGFLKRFVFHSSMIQSTNIFIHSSKKPRARRKISSKESSEIQEAIRLVLKSPKLDDIEKKQIIKKLAENPR